jgi:fatty-acyl-CoA synthase
MAEGYEGHGPLADEERFVDTGDLGFLVEGELFVTGRSKDLILRGGQKAHPQWIEESIARVGGERVRRSAAFAASGDGREEVVVFVEVASSTREACALAGTLGDLAAVVADAG